MLVTAGTNGIADGEVGDEVRNRSWERWSGAVWS